MPHLVHTTQQRNRAQAPRRSHRVLLRQHRHLRPMPHRRSGGHPRPQAGTGLTHGLDTTGVPRQLAE
eukprot:11733709-Prorocentrum_lima.AAC.1